MGSSHVHIPFQLHIYDLPYDVLCNIFGYADEATLLFSTLNVSEIMVCDSSLIWLLNLNLGLRIADWGRKTCFNFKVGKTPFALFGRPNNSGTINVKTYGSFFDKRASFKMLGFSFFYYFCF